jgi:hypothetical protein
LGASGIRVGHAEAGSSCSCDQELDQ